MLIRILIIAILTLVTSCSFKHKGDYGEVVPAGEPTISIQAEFMQGLNLEYSLNWREAAIHFDRSMRWNADAPRPHIHLARCLLFLQDIDEGIYHLQWAEKLAKKNDYVIWFDMGELYHILKMKENARVCYEKSITIYPLFQKAALALVQLDKL